MRSIKTSKAFAWVDKAALRIIRESLDRENTVASAIAVYVALAELASDHQTESFRSTHAHIASRAGVQVATVKRRLADLAEVKLVAIVTPLLKAPCSYTLLPIGDGCLTLVHSEPTLAHQEPTLAHGSKTQRATLEQSLEQSHEQGKRKRSPFVPPSLEEVKLEASRIELDATQVEAFLDHYTSNGWKVGKNNMRDWKAALRNWKRRQNDTAPRRSMSVQDQMREVL